LSAWFEVTRAVEPTRTFLSVQIHVRIADRMSALLFTHLGWP